MSERGSLRLAGRRGSQGGASYGCRGLMAARTAPSNATDVVQSVHVEHSISVPHENDEATIVLHTWVTDG